MPSEPAIKRTIAFIDGQNLFYSVKQAFGYSFPNYDPQPLAEKVCDPKAWDLTQTNFYTGIPDAQDNAVWNHFWTAKMAVMGTRGVKTFTRPLRYRHQTIQMPDEKATTILVGQEKGIDIRIALDMVRLARENQYDVALLFSQDQDLSEAVNEIKNISVNQNRWIRIACAFPASPVYKNTRGIAGTEWVKIDRQTYDNCIDSNDYRSKK